MMTCVSSLLALPRCLAIGFALGSAVFLGPLVATEARAENAANRSQGAADVSDGVTQATHKNISTNKGNNQVDSAVTSKPAQISEAIFAGGCFWCMQPAFDKTPGVIETIVGYTGGSVKNPTYEQIGTGKTGHAESILVRYDPSKVTYAALLDEFWKNIDPTQVGGQFADRGPQYRTAIFYLSDEQKAEAEKSKRELDASKHFKAPIVTEIDPATEFYPAEEEHQKYYKKNAAHYQMYKYGSGRAGFLEEQWGKR